MSSIKLNYEPTGITTGTTVQMFVDSGRVFKVVDDQGVIFDSSQAGELMTANFNISGTGVTSGITTDYRVEIGTTVQFNDLTNNSPTQWYWDLGDGDTSIVQNPTHIYTTLSTGITVTLLTAKDGAGDYVSKTNFIEVYTNVDPDALAFLNAAGIVDANITLAIDNLVKDLKADSLWNKFYAIYPFVGGTASTHKWNLKDPRDLDAAYRLIFSGGWTHSSTGAQPNGTNGFANTKFSNSTGWVSNTNASIGFQSRTNQIGTICDMGAGNITDGSNSTALYSRYSGDVIYSTINGTGVTPATSNTSSIGLFIASRALSTEHKRYKRGSSTINATITNGLGTIGNYSIYIGAGNSLGNADSYSSKEFNFAFIGEAFDETEVNNLWTALQAFQTQLGR